MEAMGPSGTFASAPGVDSFERINYLRRLFSRDNSNDLRTWTQIINQRDHLRVAHVQQFSNVNRRVLASLSRFFSMTSWFTNVLLFYTARLRRRRFLDAKWTAQLTSRLSERQICFDPARVMNLHTNRNRKPWWIHMEIWSPGFIFKLERRLRSSSQMLSVNVFSSFKITSLTSDGVLKMK